MTIGESIRKIRKERGYSRERLARKLGTHHTTIVHWEWDISYPRLNTLIQLADFFDVSLDELVGRRM